MKFNIIGRIKFRAFRITFKEVSFEKEMILAPTASSGTYDLWSYKDSWVSVGYLWDSTAAAYKLKLEAGIKNSWVGKVKLFNHTWTAPIGHAERRILVNDRGIFLSVETLQTEPTGPIVPSAAQPVPLARPSGKDQRDDVFHPDY